MTRDEAVNYLALNKPSSGYPGLCEAIDMAIAALRDRPAPPDDLEDVAMAARRGLAFGHQATPQTPERMIERKEQALGQILDICERHGVSSSVLRAPAPVAAPALIRHATSCRAYANYQPPYEECTCAAPAPETPAPDAMPEAQVDDVIVREVTDSVRRVDGLGWAYLRDGAVWIGSGDASICRVERNGVVIWRRQEAQP
jgi:hypothetical protein